MREWRRPFLAPDDDAVAWVRAAAKRVIATHAKDADVLAERLKVTVAESDDAAEAVSARIEHRIEEMRDAAPAVVCRIVLTAAGNLWAEHLTDEDLLRQEVSLAGIGGRDPLVVYKSESTRLEKLMYADIDEVIVQLVATVTIVRGDEARATGARNERARSRVAAAGLAHELAPMAAGAEDAYMNRAQRRAAKKRAGKRG